MGLISGLYFLSNLMWGGVYHRVVQKHRRLALKNQAKETQHERDGQTNGHVNISVVKKKDEAERESTIWYGKEGKATDCMTVTGCVGLLFFSFFLKTVRKKNPTCFCVNRIIFEKHSSASLMIFMYGPLLWCSRSGQNTSIPSEALYLKIHSLCTVYSLKEVEVQVCVITLIQTIVNSTTYLCVVNDGFSFLINYNFYKIAVTILFINERHCLPLCKQTQCKHTLMKTSAGSTQTKFKCWCSLAAFTTVLLPNFLCYIMSHKWKRSKNIDLFLWNLETSLVYFKTACKFV